MNATQDHKNLHEYFDGELTSDEGLAFELHLKDCPTCRAELQSLADLSKRVSRLPREIEPAGDLWKNVEETVKRKRYPYLNALRLRTNGSMRNIAGGVLRRREGFTGILRAAAVLTVVATGGVLWLLLRTAPEEVAPPDTIISQLSVKTDSAKFTPKVSRQAAPVAQAPTARKVERSPKQRKSADVPAKQSTLANTSTVGRDSALSVVQPTTTKPTTPNSMITGRILDESGQPLVGATVLVVGTPLGAASDTNGIYVITRVPPGTYAISAAAVGFNSQQVNNLKVSDTSTTNVNMTLTSAVHALAMAPVEITAERPLIMHNSTTTMSVSPSPGTNIYLRGGRSNEDQYPVGGMTETKLEADELKYGGGWYDADYGKAPRPAQAPNTEAYEGIVENQFLGSTENPVSTFSIDVDNASYSNMRRFINDGEVPPKDAVRIEEMINYFTYDYPQPENEHPFSITTELADCPWNSEHKLVLIGLQGRKIEMANLPPANLVFLIDVSGSMNQPNKLPLVKSAFRMLVQELRPQDRVTIVVYAGNAGMVLPSTQGSDKERILSSIDRLEAGGSTAGGEGLKLAYSAAKESFRSDGNNRVILATDGDFNVGITSDEDLVRLIEERRDQGIYLSVLGFGKGNLKDSKMEKLADKGNGNYAYIDNIQEARRVFVGQLAGTIYTIAKDVKIQVEFNPRNVRAYRLIGYENRKLAREDFNNDLIDAGELGSGHSVTALYEIVPFSSQSAYRSADPLKYQSDGQQGDGKFSDEAMTVKLRYKPPKEETSKLLVQTVKIGSEPFTDASVNLRFASSVAEFGMLLKDSKFKASSSYDHVISVSRSARGSDTDGYRAEFIRLVQACKGLRK